MIPIAYLSTLLAVEPPFEIPYFPEVVFKGTPLTVHIRAPEQQNVRILSGQNELHTVEGAGSTVREITLFPEKSTTLSFIAANDSEKSSWLFTVLEPGFQGNLEEHDGYLYFDQLPVILMPVHRLPPPLDRRWETVEMVENLMQSQKPVLPGMQLWTSSDSRLSSQLKEIFPDLSLEIRLPNPESWFRVHGILTANTSRTSEFVVVEMDLVDFERGMSPQSWFMKWQFTLQHLQVTTGFKDGLLFGPAYSPDTLKWKAILDEKLKGLASAHGLRFIDRSHSPDVWKERLLNQLGKIYQLP